MLRRLGRIQELAKLVENLPGSAPQHLASRCQLHTSSLSAGQPPKDDTWFPPEAVFYPHQHQWHDKYCRQRNVMAVGPRFPALATNVYVAPSAVVAGDVDILDGATIMHGAVLRGDLNNISIGAFSSVQENCVIHAARSGPTNLSAATSIGKAVTIGAGSLLRSCKIEDMAVIGERCIVLEGSIVSEHVVLLPGTVVPPAKLIPKGQVWAGNPAQFVRNLTHDEELEVPQLTNSHEKWRDLYTVEELPYGNGWKRAEAIDPAEARLFPDEQQPPEWVPQNVKDSKKQLT